MTPTVSVALGTHNGAAYIEEQVRSILDQSVPPDEIVISDDASTDGTVDRARTILDGVDVRVRILRNTEALGVSGNFEQAILACSSEFVALSDQDDRWHPRRIELSLAAFAATPALQLVHGDANLIDGDGHPLGVTLFTAIELDRRAIAAIHQGGAFDVLMRRNVVTGATAMVRRSLAVEALPFPSAWVHDEWLAIIAAAKDAMDVVDEPLIDYRQHQSNQIGVEKLGLLGKARRMLQPGAERSARLLSRATQLEERLRGMPEISVERRTAAGEKVVHERMRSALGARRSARALPVLRELGTGRYSAFGRGALDALRDVLQPLTPAG